MHSTYIITILIIKKIHHTSCFDDDAADFSFSTSIFRLFISLSRFCRCERSFCNVLMLTASAWIVLAILWSSSLRMFWFEDICADSISTLVISRRISGIVRSIFVSMSAMSSRSSRVDFLFDDSKLSISWLKLKFELSSDFWRCSKFLNRSVFLSFSNSFTRRWSNRCVDSNSWTWERKRR